MRLRRVSSMLCEYLTSSPIRRCRLASSRVALVSQRVTYLWPSTMFTARAFPILLTLCESSVLGPFSTMNPSKASCMR